jgi:hypothetical protein
MYLGWRPGFVGRVVFEDGLGDGEVGFAKKRCIVRRPARAGEIIILHKHTMYRDTPFISSRGRDRVSQMGEFSL